MLFLIWVQISQQLAALKYDLWLKFVARSLFYWQLKHIFHFELFLRFLKVGEVCRLYSLIVSQNSSVLLQSAESYCVMCGARQVTSAIHCPIYSWDLNSHQVKFCYITLYPSLFNSAASPQASRGLFLFNVVHQYKTFLDFHCFNFSKLNPQIAGPLTVVKWLVAFFISKEIVPIVSPVYVASNLCQQCC